MVAALHEVEGSDEPLKRIQPFQNPITKKLHNFLTKKKQIRFCDSWHIPGVPAGRPQQVGMSCRLSTKQAACPVSQSCQ